MKNLPNRRSFIIASGMTALASTRVLGANEALRVGVIGAGGRMGDLLDAADKVGGYQIAAVSDVYGPRIDAVKKRPSGTAATTHADYRELLQQLVHAVRSTKRILQCGMQQRSWSHFRDAVDLIQGGSLGRVPQVRTYWWQNYGTWKALKPVDTQALDWKSWLGNAPEQPFSAEKFYRWRWYWNFGGGAMTDLMTHWIDVVHWAMKADTPRDVHMLGDKYIFEQWECPDTVQALLRYPGFDVVYEGMMASSIDDGGLEFRGTEATLKISRSGFAVHHEGASGKANPVVRAESFQDGTIDHMQNFLDCVKSRKEPNAPVETGVAAARAGQIANLAYGRGGQVSWPPKS